MYSLTAGRQISGGEGADWLRGRKWAMDVCEGVCVNKSVCASLCEGVCV